MSAAFIGLHFVVAKQSITLFYSMCFVLGIGVGYWAVFMTIAAEQFGTNIRATVATSVPNFVRGAVVPLTMTFNHFKSKIGIVPSAAFIGVACVLIALWALRGLDETHGKDLDYIEPV